METNTITREELLLQIEYCSIICCPPDTCVQEVKSEFRKAARKEIKELLKSSDIDFLKDNFQKIFNQIDFDLLSHAPNRANSELLFFFHDFAELCKLQLIFERIDKLTKEKSIQETP